MKESRTRGTTEQQRRARRQRYFSRSKTPTRVSRRRDRLRNCQALCLHNLNMAESFVSREAGGLINRPVNGRLGPALVTNSLCPGQEKHTMRELEVQIANSAVQ